MTIYTSNITSLPSVRKFLITQYIQRKIFHTTTCHLGKNNKANELIDEIEGISEEKKALEQDINSVQKASQAITKLAVGESPTKSESEGLMYCNDNYSDYMVSEKGDESEQSQDKGKGKEIEKDISSKQLDSLAVLESKLADQLNTCNNDHKNASIRLEEILTSHTPEPVSSPGLKSAEPVSSPVLESVEPISKPINPSVSPSTSLHERVLDNMFSANWRSFFNVDSVKRDVEKKADLPNKRKADEIEEAGPSTIKKRKADEIEEAGSSSKAESPSKAESVSKVESWMEDMPSFYEQSGDD